MTLSLQKLLGTEVNSLFCGNCKTFTVMMIGQEYSKKCSVCNNKIEVANIKIKKTRENEIKFT